MNKLFLILFLVFMPAFSFGQEILVEESPVVGRLMKFEANVEITKDENGLPSHTIEWDSDDPLMEFSETFEESTKLVVPTGLKAKVFKLKLRVINWKTRTINVDRVSVTIKGNGQVVDPGPVDPGPVDPPVTDDKLIAFEKMVKESLENVSDRSPLRAIANEYSKVMENLDNRLSQAKLQMRNARSKALLSLPALRSDVFEILEKFDTELGVFKTTEDYKKAMEIVIRNFE